MLSSSSRRFGTITRHFSAAVKNPKANRLRVLALLLREPCERPKSGLFRHGDRRQAVGPHHHGITGRCCAQDRGKFPRVVHGREGADDSFIRRPARRRSVTCACGSGQGEERQAASLQGFLVPPSHPGLHVPGWQRRPRCLWCLQSFDRRSLDPVARVEISRTTTARAANPYMARSLPTRISC